MQIRNRASLAGNICNASPAARHRARAAASTTPTSCSPAGPGERRVPVADFVLGPRRTDLRPGEIVTAVELPRARASRLGTTFARLTRRRGVDLATLSLCCARRRDAGPGSRSARWRPDPSSSTTTAACSPTRAADDADRERVLRA